MGFFLRSLALWMALASPSLPVPFSPLIRTLTFGRLGQYFGQAAILADDGMKGSR